MGGAVPNLTGSPGHKIVSDIVSSQITVEVAEEAIVKLVKVFCFETKYPFDGTSIQCDGEVRKVRMQKAYAYRSLQILDVLTAVGLM